ncbi:hypothetical protein [Kribbella sindirgiensis]|uniref:Uncharacterized protein n=1 Tax=Kribbella sindirgiensis TaxID=1124744 RepID=A0A4R0J6A4_9ACTN|nr:hypothetical protein [Kribbella sindirgiensis]TCC39738.1 hypothetical protein E0H50_07420 [Kribbella sindirgiensis]
MERVLLDDVVETDYGQFDLVWGGGFGFDGDADRFFAGQVNGLVGAAHGDGVYMHFGRRSGGSPVRIVLADVAPGVPEESWEDVVEVSIDVRSEDVGWTSWGGESGGDLDGVAAGSYRLRVSARGRDIARDREFADGLFDAYLLELWPAPAEPDAILRIGSEDARYWHREWGSRRPT